MLEIRCSMQEDVPALRTLWTLCDPDHEAYINAYFEHYYNPDSVFVLTVDGVILAMGAWFDTAFAIPKKMMLRFGCLHTIVTHPDHRGKGYARQLIAAAEQYMKEHGIAALTVVPATEEQHETFARHGFQDFFTYHNATVTYSLKKNPAPPNFKLDEVRPEQYAFLRESILAKIPHISYPENVLNYQLQRCKLSGGGLYAAETGHGVAALCVEGDSDGALTVTELLANEKARKSILVYLPQLLPKFSGKIRMPGVNMQSAMLKWMASSFQEHQASNSSPYFGMLFD